MESAGSQSLRHLLARCVTEPEEPERLCCNLLMRKKAALAKPGTSGCALLGVYLDAFLMEKKIDAYPDDLKTNQVL